jgi:phenylacetate-CoA ligase
VSLLPRRPIIQMYQLASGRRLLTRLDELNQTQWLSSCELQALQSRKLHRLLTHAYARVPYYHELFDRCGFQPDDVLTDLESFRRLPVLTKDIVRQSGEAMLTTDASERAGLAQLSTSGSTGRPMDFYQDSSFRDLVTADIHRHLGWAGWELGDIHCYVWGRHFGETTIAERVRVGLMNWTLNRFVTDAYRLTDDSLATFAQQVRRHRPRVIFGYPSSLCLFARHVRERRLDDIRFEAIFTSAELIFQDQRRYLEEAFGGRVFNRYGSRELGGISCECDQHVGMHVSADNNLIEILKDGRPAEPGEVGDVVVTNLNNLGMPFIRYSIDDLGAWSTQTSCPCGRALPLMDLTQARRSELFPTRDGREARVTGVWSLFGAKGMRQFQIVQKSLDLVVVRIVRDGEPDQAKLEAVETTLKELLGSNVEVRFEFPDEIPVSKLGKHRYLISEARDQVAGVW